MPTSLNMYVRQNSESCGVVVESAVVELQVSLLIASSLEKKSPPFSAAELFICSNGSTGSTDT